jgi:excisionase family DNA binding protein
VARRLAPLPDAAKYIGVTERTLRRWIAAGTLTGYRLGAKTLRVDLNEVDDKLCRPIPTARPRGDAA